MVLGDGCIGSRHGTAMGRRQDAIGQAESIGLIHDPVPQVGFVKACVLERSFRRGRRSYSFRLGLPQHTSREISVQCWLEVLSTMYEMSDGGEGSICQGVLYQLPEQC